MDAYDFMLKNGRTKYFVGNTPIDDMEENTEETTSRSIAARKKERNEIKAMSKPRKGK